MSNKFRSTLIENNIPSFIRQDYPNFVEFIKVYYSQQDNEGEAYEFIGNILKYSDIDLTSLEFLDNFARNFIYTLKDNIDISIDKRNLISNIKQFYGSGGSEKSIQFIFRVLFNEEVNLYYPSNDVLRVSDGKWSKNNIIKISNNRDNGLIVGLEGTEILGALSGAIALVESVTLYTASNGFHVAECAVSTINPVNSPSSFIVGETITGTTIDGITSISEKIYSIITDISLDVNALYNKKSDVITVTSNVGVDSYITIDEIESGSIDDLEIIQAGTGYSVNDIILFPSTSGRNAKAIVESVDGIDGSITGIKMISEGYGYQEMPLIDIRSTGTGAILYPVSTSIGKIKRIGIIDHGVNYLGSEFAGFPYTFPINFIFVEAKTSFNTNAFIYDFAWNEIEYLINETVEGSISGAQGIIKHYNRSTNSISFKITNDIEFIEGDNLIGISSGASGFYIHKIFQTAGNIVPGALGTLQGIYRNTDGYVSGNKYIQDSYYYQDFSYVITTLKNKSEWISSINDLVHPSGTIVFGFGLEEGDVSSFSYGGFISPTLNNVEFYKYNWQEHLSDTLTWTDFGDTQISAFADIVIYKASYIDVDSYESGEELYGIDDINTIRKTNICFGSKIAYEFADIGQSVFIDELNQLLIDTENILLL